MRGWGGWRRWKRFLGGLWGVLVAAVLVAAVGTAGSVVFHSWWKHTVDVQNSDRLDRSVVSRVSRVTDNLTRYLDALRAVGALVRSDTGVVVGRDDLFESFVQGMDVQRRYAAMQSLGWQMPVSEPRIAGLVSQMRRAGHPGLTIRPPGRRPEYAVLVYQHSAQPVAWAPGADRRADPDVSAVLDRTRDTGEPALLPSPVADDREAGVFLLFLPIYRSADAAVQTVPARRAALLGWVSAQIHADRFLTEALSGITAGNAGVQLLDNAQPRPIATDPDGFHPDGPYVRSVDLAMAGRVWHLGLAPLPGSILIQDANPADAIGLFGGIALSLLLAAMTVMITAQARTTRALRTANQRSADMVAMLSHDARQPLMTIINYSQLVLEDWHDAMTKTIPGDPALPSTPVDAAGPAGTRASDDADIPASLGRVIGAAHRLNHLVDDVLATARLDAIPTHNARPVLVDQIIAEAVSDSGAPGMLIDTTAVEAVWAHADPTHLRQIIANLIGNALKYGAPPVIITARHSGNHVAIDVADAGPGVPADFVNHLFDRFTRATTATTANGSGFGLYIVQRLAEANGGEINYQPCQPTGASFTLTLPAANLASTETAHQIA
jgi:signal transduction histidine kinase